VAEAGSSGSYAGEAAGGGDGVHRAADDRDAGCGREAVVQGDGQAGRRGCGAQQAAAHPAGTMQRVHGFGVRLLGFTDIVEATRSPATTSPAPLTTLDLTV
jgi:hypothetical protein